MFKRFLPLIALVMLVVSGCATQHHSSAPSLVAAPSFPPHHTPAPSGKVKTGTPYQVAGVWYYPIASNAHYDRTGIASWYGKKFHGRKTANGERYDMYAMTAAHTTLPLPSYAKVTNLSNGRSVVVRINDRGPFVKDRIIDLSYAAAQKLDMIQHGTARVRVQTLDSQGHVTTQHSREHQRERVINGRIYLQLAAFQSFDSARSLRQRLVSRYPSVDIVHHGRDDLYRVRLGPFSDEWHSKKIQTQLQHEGFPRPIMVVQ